MEGVSGGVGVWDDRGDHRAMVVEMAALVDMAQNVITYGFGSKKDLGLRSPEFFTSTVVDTGVNVLLGLVTAGIVAVLVTAGIVSVGWVGFAGLAIGFGVSWAWSLAGGPEWAKGLKQRWAQTIRRAGQGTAPDTDDLLDDWPDTPNGLAP